MDNNNLREKYTKLFAKYPDVVELNDLLEMLGGVSESYVRPLLRNGIIKSFKLGNGKIYKIPKEYLIDFVVSDAYQDYKCRLKSQI